MDTSSTTEPLADLVRRAQKGEEPAQRALILNYQRRVAGFIYAIVGRSDSIEDLAQTVFIKMVRGLERLHDPAQFEAWLFRLARNACIDYLRRQRLRRIFTPFAAEHTDIPEPPGAVDTEELDALRHALSRLRPADRALLALAQEGAARPRWRKSPGPASWSSRRACTAHGNVCVNITSHNMKPESYAWKQLEEHAAAQLSAGFASRVLRASQSVEPAGWSQLEQHAAAHLEAGFADRVLRVVRAAIPAEIPSFFSQFALSAATAAFCMVAAVYLHDRTTRIEDERSLAAWERLAADARDFEQGP